MSLSVERMCALALDYLMPEEYEAALPPLRHHQPDRSLIIASHLRGAVQIYS